MPSTKRTHDGVADAQHIFEAIEGALATSFRYNSPDPAAYQTL